MTARMLVLVLAAASAAPLLQGCAPVVVAGAAGGASVVHDRRTAGAVVEDQAIEIKARRARNDDPDLSKKAHINITSYNGIVLLTGEAPSEALRQRMERLVQDIEHVRRVHNEIAVASPSAYSARTSDTWITSKAKTSLFKVKLDNFDPTRVKVVTERGVVYLMGLVSRTEADAVVDQVRQVGGVQRVVKVFEYVT